MKISANSLGAILRYDVRASPQFKLFHLVNNSPDHGVSVEALKKSDLHNYIIRH